MGELAAVRSRDVRPRACRRHEPREPVRVVRDRVLGREDDRLAPRELDAEVARAAVAELLGRDLVHDRAGGTRSLGAPVRRARVDDDHLDVLVDLLRGDPVQAAREVGAAVLDRDDDRDHARCRGEDELVREKRRPDPRDRVRGALDRGSADAGDGRRVVELDDAIAGRLDRLARASSS